MQNNITTTRETLLPTRRPSSESAQLDEPLVARKPLYSIPIKLHQSATYRLLCPIAVTIILSLFVIHFVQLGSRWNPQNQILPSLFDETNVSCGESPAEARSLGCVFDVYINGWLPPTCYDRAVAEKSESNFTDLYPAAAGRTTFPLFWDAAMTRRATLEDVMLTAFKNIENDEVDFYVAWEFHRAHCLHLWRLTVSALHRLDLGEKDVGVYYKCVDPEHAWHCNKIMIDGDTRDPNDITSINPGVGKCVVLNRA